MIASTTSPRFLLALLFHASWFWTNVQASCSNLADYRLPEVGPLAENSPPGPFIVGTVAAFQAWTEGIAQYETPLALRFTHLIDMMSWNCIAAYSPDWKDAVTRGSYVINTPALVELDDGSMIDLHTSETRLLCMANAFATVVDEWVPEASGPLLGTLDVFAYPDLQAGYDSDVDACFAIAGDGSADLDCIATIAADRCYTPSVMGAIVGRHMTEYARRDGFNMFGDLNRDGTPCVANCRRYTDFTNYNPVNTPGKSGQSKRWQPLLEDNGRGYFTRQEHVTPHIGYTAQRLILTDEDFECRTVPKPNYNYNQEAFKVTERMATLDDEKKMLIEFFDDKIAVAFAVIGSVVANGAFALEQAINFIVGFTGAEYDSILLAWRRKVETDLVRPTTWIQDQMSDTLFTTWAGPFEGVKTIPGKNFESYIRVMPHSEFVSGSGCICQAVYEYTDLWVENNLGLTDSIKIPLQFLAGTSKTEPGVTPATDLVVELQNMEELRTKCGDSRLDGGMHFEASVPGSYDLCSGIGVEAYAYSASLW